MQIWDPHFHIWDVRPNSPSGHDSAQLFAPDEDPIYTIQRYEADLSMEGFELIGGTFVEAVSVCHVEHDGPFFENSCIAEARWVTDQCSQSKLPYQIVATGSLESPNWPSLFAQLQKIPNVCGIRQILNHEPSWPRNHRLGNLLDSYNWQQGFSTLAEADYSFDLQCNPHQYKQAAEIFQRNPRIPVILNHLGTPKREDLLEGQKYWEGMQALANLEQVSIKLSMLTYPNKQWHQDALIKETVNKVIDLFGVQRCIFASNYPVEKLEGWNAQSMYQEFQKLVDNRSQEEQDALFSLNAMRIYRV